MLTQARLKEVLHYETTTGIFTYLLSRRTTIIGTVAGTIWDGYRWIYVEGKRFSAHRLAWLYVYGEWPKQQTDHINGIRDDNRIENLRDVSVNANQQNVRYGKSDNTSGYLGVSKRKDVKAKPWRAQILINGRMTHLGYFETPELAHAAYIKAKRIHHIGCTI